MKSIRTSITVFVCGVSVGLAGCFGGGSDHPVTVPVSGVIRYQSKPLDNGTVQFNPMTSSKESPARPSSAMIKPDGSYQMSTFSSGDGLMPGEYLVSIKSYKGEVTLDTLPQDIVWAIPKRYGEASSSELKATVTSDQSSGVELDFDLMD